MYRLLKPTVLQLVVWTAILDTVIMTKAKEKIGDIVFEVRKSALG